MGALGHGFDFTDKFWPTKVEPLENERVVQVACGQHHTAALTERGEVWVWGMSRYGQLGRPTREAFMLTDLMEVGEDLRNVKRRPLPPDGSTLVKNDPLAMAPKVCPLFQGLDVYKVVCGWYQTSVITTDGDIYSVGSEHGSHEEKLRKLNFCDVVDMDHGWKHTVLITT